MAKRKKLSIDVVKREDAKTYSGKKVIDVKGYTLEVQEKFRPTALQALLAEYLDKMALANVDDNIDADKIDWVGYMWILLIKYFTDLEIPDDFHKQIHALKILMDNDYLSTIINAFDEAEMEKWLEVVKNVGNTVNAEQIASYVKLYMDKLEEVQIDVE